MKKLTLMLILSLILIVGCQAGDKAIEPASDAVSAQDTTKTAYEPGTWITDYKLALGLSEELGLPVLINFTGSDWCPWCFRLRDEVFVQPEFIDFAKENLILLTIDFPSKTKLPPEVAKANQALAEKYDIEGFPTILIINSQEELIAQTGYQDGGAGPYVEYLRELMQAAADE